MTRNRVIRMVVLCEDRQQEYFARHYFKLRGYDHKRMRFIVNPKGEGAGEQFVRQQYPDQVRAHRYQASSQSSVALVVLIDADMQTVEQRKNALDTALQTDGQDRRQMNERIAIFVPKRNIETWILYPSDLNTNEAQIYPKLAKEADCLPAIKAFVENL